MSTTHPEADRLLAWLDGTLPPHEKERIAEHVAGCIACRSEVERVRTFERLVAERRPDAGLADDELSVQLLAHARQLLVPRRPFLVRVAPLLAAAVFLATLTLALLGASPGFSARALVVDPGIVERGSAPPRVHFELSLASPRAIAVLALDANGARRVYPHPNPVLGLLGMPEVLGAARGVRLPAEPLFDFETTRDARYLVVPSATPFDQGALLALEQAAASGGEAAVRARWPEARLAR
jgi:putative zinc finger protein